MPEVDPRRLSQVINYIKDLIESKLAKKTFWLKVELSNINFHNSGHCYLDLVENLDGITIAQCKGSIWATNLLNIKNELGNDFSNILKKGGEILCKAEVNFHQVHGLSINIIEVDKYFALGELERKMQETLKKLMDEGLLNSNKLHVLPIVVQKIAIIGSVGTSGHTDFLKQLDKNEYGYRYYVENFNCLVQGDKAATEIINQLSALEKSSFDVVVLIRGGGSKLDLEVFNSYDLGKKIALHSKPILTGIGHETDVSIADIVSNQHFKTPSALGAYFVSKTRNFETNILNTFNKIITFHDEFMLRQNHRIRHCATIFKTTSISYTRLRRGDLHMIGNRLIAVVKNKLAKENQFNHLAKQDIKNYSLKSLNFRQNRLDEISKLVPLHSHRMIGSKKDSSKFQCDILQVYLKNNLSKQTNFLNHAELLLASYHPDKVLDRGYSISRKEGKVITISTNLNKGDELEVELIDRKIRTSIISIQNKKQSIWKTLLTKMQLKS